MIIIGITGTFGAGKGTVVECLVVKYGFAHFSARAVIADEIKKRGLPENRDTMRQVANDLRAKHGSAYVLEQLLTRALASGADRAVLESVRTLGEIAMLRKIKPPQRFYLLGVDTKAQLRYERNVARGSTTDQVNFADFLRQEHLESVSKNPAEINLLACLKSADFVLTNNGSVAELYAQVDEAMQRLSLSKQNN